jgi:hypothetical protein
MKLLIIVPVHHRPQNAAMFMESLFVSLSLSGVCDYNVEAVAGPDVGDTADPWLDYGARVWVSEHTSFPLKVQETYDRYLVTDEVPEWSLLIGDDVKFRGGWWEAFLEAAKDPDAGLISSNDMGNPYVTSGTHATHPFISTKYVEEQGASWDGPGHICHTGYRHWWVDEEWSVKANHDGVFRYAPDCKIEHLHPTWGKGQQDDTYAIGWKHGADDADLYQRRHEHAKTQGWA